MKQIDHYYIKCYACTEKVYTYLLFHKANKFSIEYLNTRDQTDVQPDDPLYMSKSKCKNVLKTISLISIPSCDNVLCTFKGQDVWVSLLSFLDVGGESIFNIE